MIRGGDINDLDLVLSIQRESWLAGFAHIFPPERYPYPEESLRLVLRQQLKDRRNILLVENEGRGFALVAEDWLERLFVRERAWGTGTADELHSAALEAFRSQGLRLASLWCLAENKRARRFYEKRGWHLNGRERVVPFPPHPLDIGYSIEL